MLHSRELWGWQGVEGGGRSGVGSGEWQEGRRDCHSAWVWRETIRGGARSKTSGKRIPLPSAFPAQNAASTNLCSSGHYLSSKHRILEWESPALEIAWGQKHISRGPRGILAHHDPGGPGEEQENLGILMGAREGHPRERAGLGEERVPGKPQVLERSILHVLNLPVHSGHHW